MNSDPRILIVTPEITLLPKEMGNIAAYLQAKGGGLADVSSSLVSALFKLGVDVHVALPNYRQLFNVHTSNLISQDLKTYKYKLPYERIHLAEDRAFYYKAQVYDLYSHENTNISLRFQREVINNIIPRVKPDLIHCNDWMTGLIPAFAKRLRIPTLFTLHNIHTVKRTLAEIEDNGIDAAEFWNYLYLERMPINYEESRQRNPVDLLTSGIFAADFMNTVSPTFLWEMNAGWHEFIPPGLRWEIKNKCRDHRASGILNSPDPEFNPETDGALIRNYDSSSYYSGKIVNKRYLQEILHLDNSDEAPLFFWPSRLDPLQKGCELFSDILYQLVAKYWKNKLQVVFVCGGSHQKYIHDIVNMHELHSRVAVRNYDRDLTGLAYAASDFIIMPSLYEPCGLPQMICQKYGSLPIVRSTGGLKDAVKHISIKDGTGNGFVFEDYDSNGLSWAIDQAMGFYWEPPKVKNRFISRIMKESNELFCHSNTVESYIEIFEFLLNRPLLKKRRMKRISNNTKNEIYLPSNLSYSSSNFETNVPQGIDESPIR